MKPPKYWLWLDDSEGEIYDLLAWDLPGYRPQGQRPSSSPSKRIDRNQRVSSRQAARKRTFA